MTGGRLFIGVADVAFLWGGELYSFLRAVEGEWRFSLPHLPEVVPAVGPRLIPEVGSVVSITLGGRLVAESADGFVFTLEPEPTLRAIGDGSVVAHVENGSWVGGGVKGHRLIAQGGTGPH